MSRFQNRQKTNDERKEKKERSKKDYFFKVRYTRINYLDWSPYIILNLKEAYIFWWIVLKPPGNDIIPTHIVMMSLMMKIISRRQLNYLSILNRTAKGLHAAYTHTAKCCCNKRIWNQVSIIIATFHYREASFFMVSSISYHISEERSTIFLHC